MRCKYYDDFWGICCNGYSEYCEDDCPYEDWKECNCFCGESVKKKNKITPCYMCDNARLNNELTEENDFSSCGIGEFDKGYRTMLSSVYGKPLRIEFERWNGAVKRWEECGIYYPKYCPNCGREIKEYESNDTER